MNELPLFYCPQLYPGASDFMLDEDTRRHVVTVLRMQEGDELELTNGNGLSAVANILIADKKKLGVAIQQVVHHALPQRRLILGVALLKNASRFEWMLEKVTEIGVHQIYPVLTERTGREHFRQDRMQQIVISASLQSRQFHFPELSAPVTLPALMNTNLPVVKYIAHCMPGEKQQVTGNDQEAVLLIGPEGDFTASELQMAVEAGFRAVTLGQSRLRTETAGVVGAVLLRGNC